MIFNIYNLLGVSGMQDATHLLEEGVNIVSLKILLGHAEITTTMIYLHVAQFEFVKPHSPLDTLYGR